MDKYTIDEIQYKNGYRKGYEDGKKDAVKHGRWIVGEMVIDDGVGGHIYHCSECEDWYHAWTPNYCPNCGAKMDGGDEDG